MGGMAAQIPVKYDENANEVAFAKVRADKEREVKNGHDGTWVAHPALVSVAKEVFDAGMPTPNQIDQKKKNTILLKQICLLFHRVQLPKQVYARISMSEFFISNPGW